MEAQCLQKQSVMAAATAPSKDAAEPRDMKFQKVPHPNDGVVPEALVYGGPVLDRAIALVFTLVLRMGLVPADWLSGATVGRLARGRGLIAGVVRFRVLWPTPRATRERARRATRTSPHPGAHVDG